MKSYDPHALADQAVAGRAERPATTIVHDSADVRLVVFRIEPGQQVARHTSPSTVLLSVLEGEGVVLGADGERTVRVGDVVAYEPHEPHAMRALDERFVLLATIAPRPGSRL